MKNSNSICQRGSYSIAVLLAVALIVLGPGVLPASGQTVIDWIASGGEPQFYFDSFCWSGGEVPDTVDESARFNVSGGNLVLFSGGGGDPQDVRVSDLLVNLGEVWFQSSGPMDYIVENNLEVSGGGFALWPVDSSGPFYMAVKGEVLVDNWSAFTIFSDAKLTTGLGAPVSVYAGGSISLNGGTMDLGGQMVIDGGQVNINQSSAGQFQPRAGVLVAGGGRLNLNDAFAMPTGSTLDVQAGGNVTALDPLTLEVESVLSINGGSVDVTSLGGTGHVDFVAGTLAVSDAGGLTIGPTMPLGPNVALGSGHTLAVAGPLQIYPGANLTVESGVNISATDLVNAGVVEGAGAMALGGTVANLPGGQIRVPTGTLTFFGLTADAQNSGDILLSGGTLQFDEPLVNAASGNIQGYGTLDPDGGLTNQGFVSLGGGPATLGDDLTNESTGTIVVSGGDELSLLGAVANNGVIHVNRGGPDGHSTFSRALGNQGLVSLVGGVTDVFGEVTNSPGGSFIIADSATVKFFRSVANDGVIDVDEYSTAQFLGGYTGRGGTTGGGGIFLAGQVRPGNSVAEVLFGNDVTLGHAATLQIEIEGDVPGTYDRLLVDGHLTLGGTLAVQADFGGVDPLPGTEFDILDWQGLSGTFAHVNLPVLAGLAWDTSRLYTDGVLTLVSPGLAGDYNGDGVVDAADYTVWRDTLGSTTDLRANGDNIGASAGVIDHADFVVWKSHFGEVLGSGAGAAGSASAAAVPEPASAWLVALAAAGLGMWLGRKRGARPGGK